MTTEHLQTSRVFTYGSLMVPEEFQRDCSSGSCAGPSSLQDHRLCFPRFSKRRKSLVASIEPCAGSQVWGVAWHVSADELARLDAREGFRAGRAGNAYERVQVTVEHDGAPAVAWTYVANRERLAGDWCMTEDYHRLLVRGAVLNGLPPAYIETLKALPRRVTL